MTILVTGCAGFIGSHLVKTLVDQGHDVVGIDNLNDYYDVTLKQWRLKQIEDPHFHFYHQDINDTKLKSLLKKHTIKQCIHLAAQAGVRYSIDNPKAYIDSNLCGFANILEACRHHGVEHLIFASSSSVYGANTNSPFSVANSVDHPLSLYAATKKSNELMAHSYASLYQLPCTGLRFFTVYGPWGRPDMALFKFTHNILAGLPIDVYNHGQMLRDFTYIDDIIKGILGALAKPPNQDPHWCGTSPTPNTSYAPYRLYNLGNNQPNSLEQFISTLEEALGKQAIKNYLPLQPGDVPETCANIDSAHKDLGFQPNTKLSDGIGAFVQWYQAYYSTTRASIRYTKNKAAIS